MMLEMTEMSWMGWWSIVLMVMAARKMMMQVGKASETPFGSEVGSEGPREGMSSWWRSFWRGKSREGWC